MRKLLDVLYALAFIAIFSLAQWLADQPPQDLMLMPTSELTAMACPINDSCDGLETNP
jgi:hypothetical protein